MTIVVRRLDAGERCGNLAAIDIGDKMDARALAVGERVDRQRRTEIGATDADDDHIADRPPVETGAPAIADVIGEVADAAPLGLHLRHDIGSIDQHWPVGGRAQRHVQSGPSLAGIDALAGEKAGGPALHIGLARQVEQQPQRAASDPVLRIVEQQPGSLNAQAWKTRQGPGHRVRPWARVRAICAGPRGPSRRCCWSIRTWLSSSGQGRIQRPRPTGWQDLWALDSSAPPGETAALDLPSAGGTGDVCTIFDNESSMCWNRRRS